MAIQQSPQPNQWTFRRVMWATLIFAFIAAGFWLLIRFSQVIFIFFIAMVIGTVIRPIVSWLYSRGLSRTAGISLVYLLLLIMIVGFMLLVFPMIAEQSGKIIASLPDYYHSIRDSMESSSNYLILRLSLFLPSRLPTLELPQQTAQGALDYTKQVLGYVISGARVIFMLVAILLLSFYWTQYGTRTIQSLIRMVPMGQRDPTRDLISVMETKISAFIAGQAILCLVIGILSLVAYLIIGLPNALVLALIAGLLEAVPLLGPLLGAIPAAVIALSIAPSKLIWVIVASVVIQQLENNLLVPRIMRKAVGVNPFVTLLSIFAFSSLLGVAGALMAIPIAAIIQLLLERFVFNPDTPELEPSIGRGYASRLRYETQDLIQDLRKQSRLKKGGSALRVRQVDHLMDEIEALATDLDALLDQDKTSGAP